LSYDLFLTSSELVAIERTATRTAGAAAGTARATGVLSIVSSKWRQRADQASADVVTNRRQKKKKKLWFGVERDFKKTSDLAQHRDVGVGR
jgi:hypothetical protein